MKLLLGLLPVVFAHSCQQENLAILGDPLEVVEVADVNECVAVCSRNDDCKAITFKDGKCRVMADETTTTDVGSLTALSACFESQGGEPAAPVRELTYHTCLMEMSWIRGPTISDTTAPNALECAELCHRTSDCQYFVWKNHGARCVLLSDRTETIRAAYHTSGSMECFHPKLTHTTTAPPFTSQCLRQRYSHGDVLGAFHVPDIKGCWLACKTNALCDGLMYHTPYSKCFLMKTVKKTWEAASYVSASKNCLLKNPALVATTTAGPAAIIHPCMSWSALEGVDVGGRPVESADECLRQCTDSSLCDGFSWEWSTKLCNLKADVNGSQADTGAVSALKACFLPDISGGSDLGDSGADGSGSAGSGSDGGSGSGGSGSDDDDDDGIVNECMMPGIEQLGHQIRTAHSLGSMNCVLDCLREPTCLHIVFFRSSGTCILKAHSSDTRVNADAVSGDMSCFFPRKYTSSTTTQSTASHYTYSNPCFVQGVNYRGADIAVKSSSGGYQCAQMCSFLPTCQHFSFDELRKVCYLKRTDRVKVEDSQMVSGSMKCFFPRRTTTTTPVPTTTRPVPTTILTTSVPCSGPRCRTACFIRGTRYVGHVIKQLHTTNYNACAERCLGESTCEHLTWRNGDCLLFDVATKEAADAEYVAASWQCLSGRDY